MELQPVIQKDAQEVKGWRETTIKLGFCSICLGMLAEEADAVKCRTFMINLAGPSPKRAGDRVKVFTLGMKVISYGERMRLGFIKRRRVLEKV